MSKKRRRVSNKARSKNKEPEKKRKRKTGGELGESIPDIGWSKDDELRLVDDGVFQEAIKQFGKDFLKAIVEPILGHPITIKDFIPQKPVKVPANSYQPRLDCFIRLEPRGVIGLEVQRKVGKNLGQRMIQYQAALFSENAEKRLDDYDFQPTITIWVCEFDYFKAGKSLYPMVIKSESNADDYALPGVFRIHIFNLKAKEFINKGQEDLAHDMLCDQPSQMHSKTLADALSYIQKSKRKEAEKNSMEIYERGRADGKAEGRIEGEAEGRIEGKAEIIRALYRNGMAIETIAQYTNLSVEEVLRIVERGASDA